MPTITEEELKKIYKLSQENGYAHAINDIKGAFNSLKNEILTDYSLNENGTIECTKCKRTILTFPEIEKCIDTLVEKNDQAKSAQR